RVLSPSPFFPYTPLFRSNDGRVLAIFSAFHCSLEPVYNVGSHNVRVCFACLMRVINYDCACKVVAHASCAVASDGSIRPSGVNNPTVSRPKLVLRLAVLH